MKKVILYIPDSAIAGSITIISKLPDGGLNLQTKAYGVADTNESEVVLDERMSGENQP